MRLTYAHKMCIINVRKEEFKQNDFDYLHGGRLMKQRDLVKKLENAGFVFERHGSNHDIYSRGDEKEEIPRHKEIDERLAKAIIKRRGL